MNTHQNNRHRPLTRRKFLGTAAATASSLLVLPHETFGADKKSPNSKMNVAFIGMGGQIQGHVSNLIQLEHNVVAFCDVDEAQSLGSKKRHGKGAAGAKIYRDYRVLFEKEQSIDAVVIATPDHWHSAICKAAMEAGKHVYCEKPLTHTIAEARELRELSQKSKFITQTGNQGSASANLRRSMELIDAGMFGSIRKIHVWHPAHGWPSGMDRPTKADKIPASLDWDFWLGPAPARPYNSGIYHPAKWRGWYDFGNGSLGDFCCHSFNMPVRALNLDYPTKIAISGEGLGKESFAKSCTVRYHFPKRGDREAVELNFYTGGDLPGDEVMKDVIATYGNIPRVGCLLEGDKGKLNAGLWNRQCHIKLNDDKKFAGSRNHGAAKEIPETLPRVAGHMEEWVDACAGGPKTFADFDLGGHLTEIGLAGIVALRLQKDIEWDGEKMQAMGLPEADAIIKKQFRSKYL